MIGILRRARCQSTQTRGSWITTKNLISRHPRRVFAASTHVLPRPPPRTGYPERLLVYHAGTVRTVFIGCLKVTTILLFAFSCLMIAPTYYVVARESRWAQYGNLVILIVIVGGAIPMLFVAYTTAPFVTFIHIKLPIFARRSKDHLLRWIQKLPQTTEIDVTTMRFSGYARVSRMLLSDLKQTRARLGVANLVRTKGLSDESTKPWWRPKEPRLFYVGKEDPLSRKKSVWQTALWQKSLWQIISSQIQAK